MSWPIDEAKRIPLVAGKPILFETGYGPSGLPHIGTFTEVARTQWVRNAFTSLTHMPTRLIAFSDDMDGMRRVPDNVPNREMLECYIGLPLSAVPNPFDSKYESFAFHNNAKLCEFLNRFGFDYEFMSATHCYKSGRFNAALSRVLTCHDEIVEVIRPTLGEERAANYSPLMPIHPVTGHVLQANILEADFDTGTIIWEYEAERHITSVFNGGCKLQWKADWAMRWYALGVDYEMSGKDLIESVKLSGKICRILGREPPVSFTYELFLDQDGHKISKSKGNGLTVDDWLRYGPPESLAYYIFANPQRAKRLHFDLIPKSTDEYLQHRAKLATQTETECYENPAWFVDGGIEPPVPVSLSLLINLASVVNAEEPGILMSYLLHNAGTSIRCDACKGAGHYPLMPDGEDVECSTCKGNGILPLLSQMIDCAIAYYQDIVKPKKVYRKPTGIERLALHALYERLQTLHLRHATPEVLQAEVYEIGKAYFDPLKGWFDCLYQVLLGQTEGPRLGVFIMAFGITSMIHLIQEKTQMMASDLVREVAALIEQQGDLPICSERQITVVAVVDEMVDETTGLGESGPIMVPTGRKIISVG